MSSASGDLYQELFGAFKKSFPQKSAAECQKETNEFWRKSKSEFIKVGTVPFTNHVKCRIKELLIAATKKKSSSILSFFTPQHSDVRGISEPKPSTSSSSIGLKKIGQPLEKVRPSTSNLVPLLSSSGQILPTADRAKESETQNLTDKENEDILLKEESDRDITEHAEPRECPKPAQVKTLQMIEIYKNEIKHLRNLRDSNLLSENFEKKIRDTTKKLATEKKKLHTQMRNAKRQKKHRKTMKEKIKKICVEHPEALKLLAPREKPGQPPLVEQQPALLEAIINIAIYGSSADERRRSTMVRSCRNLSQLHEELQDMGFNLSRSGTYLHLLPRLSNSIEGRRHINTVPVKLRRARNDVHRQHVDTEFAMATIRNLETLASILGPEQVIFLSQDDKARVPLGITAANKETPILMHLEYRVRLPDHDWVVAEKHKFIPSVYAGIVIKKQEMGRPDAVSYSGPTYIAIRSGKHSSSTATTHATDLDRLLNLDSFKDLTKIKKTDDQTSIDQSEEEVKPVLIITVDGGPDENPRYVKVINHAIKHFLDYDLDAIYIATNAPGRSAYNRVERRMAPLSRQLAGLILPHDHFGTHLDARGRTVDEDLEKQNFQHAGNVLSEVWSNISIDTYDVLAEYIPPEEKTNIQMPEKDAAWYSKHVRESQYLLQISKCDDEKCCKTRRSGIKSILRDGFLPPPFPLWQTSSRLVVPNLIDCKEAKFAPLFIRLSVDLLPDLGSFTIMPYDFYCPSVQQQLCDRACKKCGLYFASKKSVQFHVKNVHNESIQRAARTRPVRVLAARRARELLCILRDQNSQSEDAEWVEEEDVDMNNISIPVNSDEETSIPVIDSIQDWIQNPWTDPLELT